MITLPSGSDIVDFVAGEPGSKSDINLWRKYRSRFHPKQKFKADLAFI